MFSTPCREPQTDTPRSSTCVPHGFLRKSQGAPREDPQECAAHYRLRPCTSCLVLGPSRTPDQGPRTKDHAPRTGPRTGPRTPDQGRTKHQAPRTKDDGLMRRSIDLNADVDEGSHQDAALMSLISSANIACGYHAGDAQSMREAVALARDRLVAVGAHPSFPDREYFGRRELRLSAHDIHECIRAQVEALADVAAAEGTRIRHVKPHGALYNMAARDEEVAEAVARAVHAVDPTLLLFALSGSMLVTAAAHIGLRTVSEAFADRAYRADG